MCVLPSPVEGKRWVHHVQEEGSLVRGEYLEEAEHLRDNDAGDDQEVADDNGGARPAEEVAQEEGQDHLGVAPQQEHHHDDQWVGLGRRHTNSGDGHHLYPQCHWGYTCI